MTSSHQHSRTPVAEQLAALITCQAEVRFENDLGYRSEPDSVPEVVLEADQRIPGARG